MAARTADEAKAELLHPVYLDASMLISFLATLDDGVSFSSEIAAKQMQAKKSSVQAEGTAKLPSLASLLGLDLGASGKYGRDSSVDDTTESKFVKQHTSASLFNRLRTRMLQDGIVEQVRPDSSLADIKPGSVVELNGKIDEIPLKKIVDLFTDIWPFLDQESAGSDRRGPNRQQSRSLPAEQRQAQQLAEVARQAAAAKLEENRATKRLVDLVSNDLESSPVVDLILKGDGVSALLTASREFLSNDVTASLVGGSFSVIGKVTAVNSSVTAETIVVRRGAMGAIAEASVLPMLESMNENGAQHGLNLDLPDGKIIGPFMQIIPLAVFV